nr:hypothetical protein 1634Bnrm3_p053 [Cryptomonas sp.]
MLKYEIFSIIHRELLSQKYIFSKFLQVPIIKDKLDFEKSTSYFVINKILSWNKIIVFSQKKTYTKTKGISDTVFVKTDSIYYMKKYLNCKFKIKHIYNPIYEKTIISKKKRRFDTLVPFFELKLRFIYLINVGCNAQQFPDFLWLLTLHLFYQTTRLILGKNLYSYVINQCISNDNKMSFMNLISRQIVEKKSTKQNSVTLLKNQSSKIVSFPNFNIFLDNYIGCIFNNINHSYFQLQKKTNSIQKNEEVKLNKISIKISSFSVKYHVFCLFSTVHNLVGLKGLIMPSILSKSKEKHIFSILLSSKITDEFGSNFFKKKQTKSNTFKFPSIFLWGDPFI